MSTCITFPTFRTNGNLKKFVKKVSIRQFRTRVFYSRFSLSVETSRLTRDGTAEPVSRDHNFSGTHGDRGRFIFPVQLTTSRTGNLTRLIHTLLYVMAIYRYIHSQAFCFPTYEAKVLGMPPQSGGTYEKTRVFN